MIKKADLESAIYIYDYMKEILEEIYAGLFPKKYLKIDLL